MKNCYKCGEILILNENWYKGSARHNSKICKKCIDKYSREYVKYHPEKSRKRVRHNIK